MEQSLRNPTKHIESLSCVALPVQKGIISGDKARGHGRSSADSADLDFSFLSEEMITAKSSRV